MDKGIPDCTDCGGKGMCDEHKLEYLEWVYKTAHQQYKAELVKQTAKFAKSDRKEEDVNSRPNNSNNTT